MGGSSAVAPLLAAVGRTEDEILIHSLTYALIEIADPQATRQGCLLRPAASGAQRCSRSIRWKEEACPPATWFPFCHRVITFCGTPQAGSYRVTSNGEAPFPAISGRGLKLSSPFRTTRQLRTRWPVFPPIRRYRIYWPKRRAPVRRRRPELPPSVRWLRAPLKETPESWAGALTAALASSDDDLLREAVSTAESLPQGDKRDAALDRALLTVGQNESLAADIRADALAASAAALESVSPQLFDFLLSNTDSAKPVPVRSAASRTLSGAPLDSEQQFMLAKILRGCRSAGAAGLAARVQAGGRRGTRRGLDGVA